MSNLKLTKEECEKALENIRYSYSIDEIRNGYEKIKQLINEHFDNPPLKFEELKKGMWVWDNVKKEYRKIYSCVYYNRGNYIRFGLKLLDDDWDYFEENRFYRREVKEDE